MHSEQESNVKAPPPEVEKAVEVLRGVLDPELGINVVDLGLIYEIRSTEQYLYVRMTMTTQGCPMHDSIAGAAQRALEVAFPDREVNVHLVWEPPWTPERLSEAARRQLGMG